MSLAIFFMCFLSLLVQFSRLIEAEIMYSLSEIFHK